jgi:hypothetical protein
MRRGRSGNRAPFLFLCAATSPTERASDGAATAPLRSMAQRGEGTQARAASRLRAEASASSKGMTAALPSQSSATREAISLVHEASTSASATEWRASGRWGRLM